MSHEEAERIRPFNPLDKKNLGESVADALLSQSVGPLPPRIRFIGAGVYAIYYTGSFLPYRDVSELNRGERFAWPIYVGKAVPAGTRKGGLGLGADPGQDLYRRLDKHAQSINAVANLSIDDFHCRHLVVDDIWIPLAENMLIEMFNPLWNRQLDGFGNNDPGEGRRNQRRSPWDEIHPGRSWAQPLKPAKVPAEQITRNIELYLAKEKPGVLARQGPPKPD